MEDMNKQQCLQRITYRLVCFLAACLLAFLIMHIIVVVSDSGRTYLVTFVFFAGLTGGFVSIQQRLPAIELSELRQLSSSWISILLIPVNGGIFAIVLMIMFLSGILEGAMFPRFSDVVCDQDHVGIKFRDWLTTTFPISGPDIAKLIFWSFVAGFSERFVPGIIRKTTDKVSGD